MTELALGQHVSWTSEYGMLHGTIVGIELTEQNETLYGLVEHGKHPRNGIWYRKLENVAVK